MPAKGRNERVRTAISKALKQRGLSHKEAAALLGLAESTVSNRISRGHFKESEAAKWSAALNIDPDVFLLGDEPLPPNSYQAIIDELAQIKEDVRLLKEVVKDIKHTVDTPLSHFE